MAFSEITIRREGREIKLGLVASAASAASEASALHSITMIFSKTV